MDLKTQSEIFEYIIKNAAVIDEINKGGLISTNDVNIAVANAKIKYNYPANLSKYIDAIIDLDANAYNELVNATYINFATLLYVINNTAVYSEDYKDRSIHSLNKIQKKIKEFSDRLNAIEIKNKYSTGEFWTFYEPFVDTAHVDQLETTSVVDTDANLVRCPYTGIKKIIFKEQDISSIDTLPSWNSDFMYASYTSGSSFKDLFLTNDAFAVYEIRTHKIINNVEATIKVEFNNIIKANYIELIVGEHLTTTGQSAMIYISTDDVSYVSISKDIQPIGNKMSLSFKETEIKFIKFVFTKQAPDAITANDIIYYFAIDNINIYSNSTIIESTFMSSEIKPPDNKEFDFATIEVCDDTPSDSTIKYYIGSSQTSMAEISPSNRSTVMSNLATIFTVDNTNKFEEILLKDLDSDLQYLFVDTNDVFLEEPTTENIIYNSVEIYKNINKNSIGIDKQNELFTNGILRGWKQEENNNVSCLFKIDTIETTIPLDTLKVSIQNGAYEPIVAVIDGIQYSTMVTLQKGLHKIIISKDDYTFLHNLLLEKADFIASDKLKMVRPGNFSTYDSSANVWTLIQTKVHNEEKRRIIVKNFYEDNLYFIMVGKSSSTIDNGTSQLFVKAILTPSADKQTPLFAGYSVKFGINK